MYATAKDHKTNATKDDMINEGGRTVHDGKAAAHHFKDDARDAATAVRDDLEGVARRTGHHARELADSAGHSLADTGKAMTVKMRDYPVQSSLIALGVGLAVGMFFRRR
jgi:ElaB/YqjD/DUF883 family membrane-anchored ribosome-binding protein